MKNINHHFYPILFLLSILLPGFSGLAQKNAQPKKSPNIVLILVDQWRGQALGYLGKEKVITPNLDALAKEGLTLTQMIANNPVCSPSRAMLMTGTFPSKNKVHCNVNSGSAPYGVELQKDAVCWSDILKQKGYCNGYIGKWHLDSPQKPYVPCANNTEKLAWNEWTPADKRHGFDYWYSYGTYDYHEKPMYWDTNDSRDNFHYVNEWGPKHEADKAIDFINNKDNVRKADAPFSLVVSINPPHSPYDQFPKKYLEPYKDIPLQSLLTDSNIPPAGTPMGEEYRKNIKNYYGNMTGVDDQLGRIIAGLKEKNLLDNTIVIFTADHGNCLGKHDQESKNNIYEESLRIPMIVYWKGRIQPGIDNKLLCSMPDIYPTLLDLAGFKASIPSSIEGTSRADYLTKGKDKMPSEQFILGAISYSTMNSGFRGVRTAQYKLAYQKKGKKTEGFLFDIKNDPFEMNNLYTPENPLVKEMKPRIEYWLKKTNDIFDLGNNN